MASAPGRFALNAYFPPDVRLTYGANATALLPPLAFRLSKSHEREWGRARSGQSIRSMFASRLSGRAGRPRAAKAVDRTLRRFSADRRFLLQFSGCQIARIARDRLRGRKVLTNKGKYGLKAVVDLAGIEPGALVQVADIAESNSISKTFLDHVLTGLRRRAGLFQVGQGRRLRAGAACERNQGRRHRSDSGLAARADPLRLRNRLPTLRADAYQNRVASGPRTLSSSSR